MVSLAELAGTIKRFSIKTYSFMFKQQNNRGRLLHCSQDIIHEKVTLRPAYFAHHIHRIMRTDKEIRLMSSCSSHNETLCFE